MRNDAFKPRRHVRKGAVIWDCTNHFAAWLYAVIARSWIGRFLTGYRRAERRCFGGRFSRGRDHCRPMSSARLYVAETVSSGHLISGIRKLFHALFTCPMMFYGLFGLSFGLFGILMYFIIPYVRPDVYFPVPYLFLYAAVMILSFPLALSAKSLAHTLGTGFFPRFLLVKLLGVPQDRLSSPQKKVPAFLPYLSVLLALPAAVLTLWVHPAVIPLAFVVLGVLGLIFTYPEAGVVLSSLLLPFVWLDRRSLIVLFFVILITWCSYGLKLLLLHRTIRLGLLDFVVLLFGVVLLFSGFTGIFVTPDGLFRSLFLTVFLSEYFLISNLITTRAYVRRCLVGTGISLVAVMVLSFVRLIPADSFRWLAGSYAGDAIVSGFGELLMRLSGLWAEHSEVYLVLAFPLLCAYILHEKRLIGAVWGWLFLAADLTLLFRTKSVGALLCVAVSFVLFGLLSGHKFFSGALYALPAVGFGLMFLREWFPIPEALLTHTSQLRFVREQLNDSLWAIMRRYPFGIGMGEEAFSAVYPDFAASGLGDVTGIGHMYGEMLLSTGWTGLILLLAVCALFLGKSLSCLRCVTASGDRAMILGGIAATVSLLFIGTMHGFITDSRMFFTVGLLLALCSAYENILFDESDVMMAEMSGSYDREDRVFRTDL